MIFECAECGYQVRCDPDRIGLKSKLHRFKCHKGSGQPRRWLLRGPLMPDVQPLAVTVWDKGWTGQYNTKPREGSRAYSCVECGASVNCRPSRLGLVSRHHRLAAHPASGQPVRWQLPNSSRKISVWDSGLTWWYDGQATDAPIEALRSPPPKPPKPKPKPLPEPPPQTHLGNWTRPVKQSQTRYLGHKPPAGPTVRSVQYPDLPDEAQWVVDRHYEREWALIQPPKIRWGRGARLADRYERELEDLDEQIEREAAALEEPR